MAVLTNPRFAIKATITPSFKIDCAKIGFDCFVDGKKVWTMHAARPDLKKSNGKWTESCNGLKAIMAGKSRIWEQREFQFASIKAVANDASSAKVKREADKMVSQYSSRFSRQGHADEYWCQ